MSSIFNKFDACGKMLQPKLIFWLGYWALQLIRLNGIVGGIVISTINLFLTVGFRAKGFRVVRN